MAKLEALRRRLRQQSATNDQDDGEDRQDVWGALYTLGFMLALGMNFSKLGWSWGLLYSLASWADVGYLIMPAIK